MERPARVYTDHPAPGNLCDGFALSVRRSAKRQGYTSFAWGAVTGDHAKHGMKRSLMLDTIWIGIKAIDAPSIVYVLDTRAEVNDLTADLFANSVWLEGMGDMFTAHVAAVSDGQAAVKRMKGPKAKPSLNFNRDEFAIAQTGLVPGHGLSAPKPDPPDPEVVSRLRVKPTIDFERVWFINYGGTGTWTNLKGLRNLYGGYLSLFPASEREAVTARVRSVEADDPMRMVLLVQDLALDNGAGFRRQELLADQARMLDLEY